MLCFTRRAGQKLRIGGDIVMSVQRVRGGSVRLGFIVPADVIVDREEVSESKQRDRVASNLKNVGTRKPSKRKQPKAAPRAAKKSRNDTA